jgi:hypothetical protein
VRSRQQHPSRGTRTAGISRRCRSGRRCPGLQLRLALLGGSNSWVESPPCAPARQPRSGRVVCPDLSVCRRAPHDVQANDLCRARRVDGLARGCPAHATRRRGKRHTEHNEAPFGLGSTSVGTECGRCCNTDVSASAKGVKALQALPVPEVGEHALRRCLWCRDFDLARPCPGSP